MKTSHMAIAALFAGAGMISATAQDVSNVDYTITDLSNGIYLLQGYGGNIAVSVGVDGVFVIDDDIRPMSAKLVAALAKITDETVTYLINTHWHFDHVGGNETLAQTGTLVLAHDNVRERMVAAEGENAWPEASWPVITFSDTTTLYYNDLEIHAFHLDNAHTDGDAVIHFRELNLIHTGDTFFNGRYPFIDVNSGGSVDGYIAAQEQILAMTDENTRIIPGHGALATPDDLRNSIAMLKDAREKMTALIADGKSLEEAQAANPLAAFDAEWSWGFINTERMTQLLYNALKQE